MPRIPTSVQDLISFCSEHGNTWQTAPTAVGLSSGQVALLKTQTGDATAAVAAQQAARDAAKAATLTANTKVATLRRTIAACIRSIVTFAEAATDPMAVFAAAQIDPTSPRTPSQPPGQPNTLSATLDDEGNITLKWKCVNPSGGNVVYNVMRRDDSAGPFTQVGVVGTRSFTDMTISAGSPSVQYQINAFRGQMAGPASPIFTLQFGHGGGGGGAFSMNKAEKVPFKVAA